MVNGQRHDDVVWSYPYPLPESLRIGGLVAFYNDRVTIEVTARQLDLSGLGGTLPPMEELDIHLGGRARPATATGPCRRTTPGWRSRGSPSAW